MMSRIPLIAANWKMHKTVEESLQFIEAFRPMAKTAGEVDIVIAPPFTALYAIAQVLSDSPIQLAGQNLYHEAQGAFTGEISPAMLQELHCFYVIVGHSERRSMFGDDDEVVNRKLKVVFDNNMIPILCVGETLEQREAGDTNAVLERQLRAALTGVVPHQAAKLVVAYEPVWAIGTGKTASSDDAQSGCAFVRSVIDDVFNGDVSNSLRVQYGGSVKPDNTRDLMSQPDIDGALVGGASLDSESFSGIVQGALPG
jgi:triosephosphate isomerase